ncbi:shikimate kinase [Hydrogenobacter hydrogenophilus]|uniref:Shikimate kinase n=1 Tax=Hydrogenobacter hydrogenophilus TaxID=35835 RepID=A0A285NYT3_9AQUI|nr:shikimate kinase [Hydrogenobacter hydrogenophilus]SNZ14083.1 shikimate kinase [Hydrogenobacter hydrogenophilus]
MKFERIFLIGFMCSGKTTVGRILAEKLQWHFYDTDEEVYKEEGMSIEEIFEKKGEEYFRDVELRVLKRLSLEKKVVISTGGGLGANQQAMQIMKEKGLVVWLDVSFDNFMQRCLGNNNRPMLRKSLKELKALYEQRRQKYLQAHIQVSAHTAPQKIAEKIIQLVQDGKI